MSSRKRVRFAHQWTLATRSDHRALLVQVEIRNRRKGPWVPLLLVTANMGGHFGPDDLRALLDHATGTGVPFVLCLQEGGDQPYVERIGKATGCTYIGGNAPGEKSTPMLVSGAITVHRARWRQVLGRVNVGAGAGPSWAKPKGWHLTRMSLPGVHFGASSFHEYASLGRRWAWGIRLAGPVVAAVLGMSRPFFLCGDLNASDSQPLVRWLIGRGMTTNHRQLGVIRTHGSRSIDAVAVQAAMVVRRSVR